MTNTEKPTTIAEKKKNIVEKTKQKTDLIPKEPMKKEDEKKKETKVAEAKKTEKADEKEIKRRVMEEINIHYHKKGRP